MIYIKCKKIYILVYNYFFLVGLRKNVKYKYQKPRVLSVGHCGVVVTALPLKSEVAGSNPACPQAWSVMVGERLRRTTRGGKVVARQGETMVAR